jgi:hypothetical protein
METLQVRAEGDRLVREHLAASLDALDQAQPTPVGKELLQALVQMLMEREA